MPDIPALIHCHSCGYWSGPTTAEDGQARQCTNCGLSLRVYRYHELHPRSNVGTNCLPVKILGKGTFGHWLYELPPGVKPPYAKSVSREYDKKRKRWIYYGVADKRTLKEIYLVRNGGVMNRRTS
jgi:hypothetical protein